MKKVAVIMGSDSDFPVVSKAVAELKAYGVPYECHVMSAHRTPALASDFADKAKENGFGVIICAAGMAAHLAGVIAGHTTLPVIGIPCKGANFDGMDALLATVQMPSGIPVATVAVDGAKNAAILAIHFGNSLFVNSSSFWVPVPKALWLRTRLYRTSLLRFDFLIQTYSSAVCYI